MDDHHTEHCPTPAYVQTVLGLLRARGELTAEPSAPNLWEIHGTSGRVMVAPGYGLVWLTKPGLLPLYFNEVIPWPAHLEQQWWSVSWLSDKGDFHRDYISTFLPSMALVMANAPRDALVRERYIPEGEH